MHSAKKLRIIQISNSENLKSFFIPSYMYDYIRQWIRTMSFKQLNANKSCRVLIEYNTMFTML